tara:strand:+ start:1833 stop:2063 length:231 start_codon:yes stop_codon:yes gene_type:complete
MIPDLGVFLMGQAEELIFLLKSIDAIGIKQNWNKEKLEHTKQEAIWEYYHAEQKIHNTDKHHQRGNLNDGDSRSMP